MCIRDRSSAELRRDAAEGGRAPKGRLHTCVICADETEDARRSAGPVGCTDPRRLPPTAADARRLPPAAAAAATDEARRLGAAAEWRRLAAAAERRHEASPRWRRLWRELRSEWRELIEGMQEADGCSSTCDHAQPPRHARCRMGAVV